ncbi:DUF4238 domain-containing protein [Paenibacillus aurantius]|uniref:DUF4238 domain-containing protein n=1 Tax=Paenibacillus aurantius TaxID=2918900 RepID=A0AA96LAP5_9BACL|nr:DUF4238 domain-containing protein [Paenibacillus aurantius]WNQ09668.1 DUF4238 domain-containing protein [Paenibacillus aurantius]
MKYKKQHWIPRSYLSAWCDNDIPVGYDPYVWLISKDWSQIKRKAPENIFYENDMYTIHLANGERNLSIEHGLSGLEDAVSKVVQNVIIKNKRLSLDDHIILCAFVAAMHERTPSHRDHLKKQWGKVLSKMESMRYQFERATPEQQNAMMSIGPVSEGPTYSTEDVRQMAETPLQTMLMPSIQTQTSLLLKMNLSILYSISKARFLTSDNPCVWFDPEAKHRPPMFRSVGLGYETVEITLPLSPRHAIILSWNSAPAYIEFPRRKVEALNYKTWLYSEDYVVSNANIEKPHWLGN